MYFDREDERIQVIGFMNSIVATYMLEILAPTIDFNVGSINRLPIIIDREQISEIDREVKNCVFLSCIDWDSYETSWDFKKHPLV